MTLVLNLGEIEIPYSTPPAKDGKDAKPVSVSTVDVANFAEAKYHLFTHFYEFNADKIAGTSRTRWPASSRARRWARRLTASAVRGRRERHRRGVPRVPDARRHGDAGLSRVPTQAALDGVNHRLKTKRGPPRPSFVDTGTMMAAFKSGIRAVVSILDEINASTSSSAINAALRSGVEAISGSQVVTFTKYVRKILPLDGFAYWVKASLLGDGDARRARAGFAAPRDGQAAGRRRDVDARLRDLHLGAGCRSGFRRHRTRRRVDRHGGRPAGATTVGEQVASGTAAGAFPVRIAVSRLGFYQNAGIFTTAALRCPSSFSSQIVDDPAQLNDAPVVSSSLPAWLTLSEYVVGAPGGPFYGIGNPLPLYPAMLVPSNAVPPYGAVAVVVDSTESLVSVPFLGRRLTSDTLTKERVKVTFYGARNDDVIGFRDCALQWMGDYDVLGLMNSPIVA